MATTTTATKASTSTPANPISIYETSTQYKNWRFSPEQLYETRTSLNATAVRAIRDKFEADEPGSSANVSFLNADEELVLVKLYTSKITQLCGHFRFPEEVEATAVAYLKRFYLKNTVMDWHPKNVMLTTLFLATKTTNNPITLEAYTSNIPKTSPSDVLDLEFLVAQSLSFEFAVWQSHRSLWGIWLDLQSIPDVPPKQPQSIYDAALNHLRASRLTDAELIFTPPQVALACLSLATPELADQWLAMKIPSPPAADAMRKTIESIKDLIQRTSDVPPLEVVREVDRRLRLCKNPEKVPGSKAWLARKAEEERLQTEKRNRKAEASRRAMDADDPFREPGDASAGSGNFGDNGQGDMDDDDD